MHKISKKDKALLFSLARKAKQEGCTLTSVFQRVAARLDMKAGSVRNFYYKELALCKDEKLTPKRHEAFSKQEEAALVKEILKQRKNYPSLRKTVLALANGDERLALRYQNKFACITRKNRQLVMRELMAQRAKRVALFNPYLEKINRGKKARLKKQIDELIALIGRKCAAENALLKQKLLALEKLERGGGEQIGESILTSRLKELAPPYGDEVNKRG